MATLPGQLGMHAGVDGGFSLSPICIQLGLTGP